MKHPNLALMGLLLVIYPVAAFSSGGQSGSRLSEEVIPLQLELVPKRPKPLLELGEPYLGTGTLGPGFQLPTGAVWQPSLLVFANFRTAVQASSSEPEHGDRSHFGEGVARLDLFANLQLSGSERLVLGFRNLDQDGQFTSFLFDHQDTSQEDFSHELNGDITTLFFEGEFGEIFPNLSPLDFKPTDVGFSLGRQPMFFQEGILINDSIDGAGLTINSLQPWKTSNFRATFFYGWNEVTRTIPDAAPITDSGKMTALLTSTDFPLSTVELDLVHVDGRRYSNVPIGTSNGADLFAFGISAVQRIGLTNTSFRLLGSFSEETQDDGYLFFTEISRTPHHTHNHLYFNGFWVNNTFRSAARDPGNGGPLARAGISFAGVGLGRYGAPLSGEARDITGGALGYQMFFGQNRRQLTLEAAARIGLEDVVQDQYGVTIRYRAALGRFFVLTAEGFASRWQDNLFYLDRDNLGSRLELLIRL